MTKISCDPPKTRATRIRQIPNLAIHRPRREGRRMKVRTSSQWNRYQDTHRQRPRVHGNHSPLPLQTSNRLYGRAPRGMQGTRTMIWRSSLASAKTRERNAKTHTREGPPSTTTYTQWIQSRKTQRKHGLPQPKLIETHEGS